MGYLMQNSSLVLREEYVSMSQMETHETKTRKKPGPVPGAPTRKYNVLLEEELGEWAKQQPGGLSELVRRLIREERQRKEAE